MIKLMFGIDYILEIAPPKQGVFVRIIDWKHMIN